MSLAGGAIRRRIERLSPAQRALLAERAHAAAATAPSSSEQLVAWVVADDGTEDGRTLAAFLRERLPEHMVPSRFVLLDALPRLPNGKVDASALPEPVRAAAVADRFVSPRTERERALADVWAAVLGTDRVGVHDNFFELGGDSILSIQVVARAKRAGLHLTPDLVFTHQTLGALAAAASSDSPAPRTDATVHTAPLAPVQAWFFEQPLAARHHWHQAAWLRPAPGFEPDRFARALLAVAGHHDALRLQFHDGPTGWTQQLAHDATVTLRDVALPACGDAEFARLLDDTMHGICAATSLARGPLVHAAVVRRDGGPAERVLLALHHLVVDAVSWEILLEDLSAAYDSDGDASILARGTPFLSWCQALAAAATTAAFDDECAYWAALPHELARLPREREAPFVEAAAETVTAMLDADTTARLVHDVHAAYNTNVEDVLLAAVARTVTAWAGRPRVLIGLERHGREALVDGADLARTVGWFTSYFPVLLEAEADAGATLRRTKDRLRGIPRRGAGYGVLRYLRGDDGARDLASRPPPELIFNHAGRLNGGGETSVWQRLGPPTASRGRDNGRTHRLEVNTFIAGGELHVHWTGSTEQYDRATIESLALRFVEELRALVAHTLTARTSGFTPADFPDAGLDQAALDRFLEGLGA